MKTYRLTPVTLIACLVLFFSFTLPALAAKHKLDTPPLSERWFSIYMDNERTGFYRQTIAETADGYRMEGEGSVRMKVMGFSKEATSREIYEVGKNLSLRSVEVEQNINGALSRISGKVAGGSLRLRIESSGKKTDKLLKFRGEIFPGPALNLYPLMLDGGVSKMYKILTFDPEEFKVKEVKITVLGEEKTAEGMEAIKLRNNLYPFVNNDIWIDAQGNTIIESVRDGLVTTRAEDPRQLAAFVGNVAIARKDLIYDFSLVRSEPPVKDQSRLAGLAVEITGWNDSLPLMQEGAQVMEKSGEGRIIVRTGSSIQKQLLAKQTGAAEPLQKAADNATAAAVQPDMRDRYLKPAEKIEADAPEIMAKAKEIIADRNTDEEKARALAAWTADWLKDTVDDSGGALASMKARYGNCQTHSRLYTALARATGIPTRFVSGLVSLEGKGFLYHSWAESFLNGKWVAVDPTYKQLPADPTHIKLFEGHTQEEMAPIISIIGRISIKLLEAKY